MCHAWNFVDENYDTLNNELPHREMVWLEFHEIVGGDNNLIPNALAKLFSSIVCEINKVCDYIECNWVNLPSLVKQMDEYL